MISLIRLIKLSISTKRMNNVVKLLGISGVARSGKDTFFSFMKKSGLKCERLAFADELKRECLKFLLDNTNISSFTEDPVEKEIIRPFLVTYGTHIRRKLNPNCWIDKVNRKAKQLISDNVVPVVTDVRYRNEADWIHEMGGKLIHISRTKATPDFGEMPIPPSNQEEKDNDPILISCSDGLVAWQTYPSLDMCKPIVQKCLKDLQIIN